MCNIPIFYFPIFSIALQTLRKLDMQQVSFTTIEQLNLAEIITMVSFTDNYQPQM